MKPTITLLSLTGLGTLIALGLWTFTQTPTPAHNNPGSTLEQAGHLRQDDSRFLTLTSAQIRTDRRFENAREPVRRVATRILTGQDIHPEDLQDLGPEDILALHMSDVHTVGDTTLATQSSLWREAVNFQHVQALEQFVLTLNVDVNSDGHSVAFQALDAWADAADRHIPHGPWTDMFQLYLAHGGDVNAEHPAFEHLNLLEHAAMSHFEAVDMLIAAGANPWVAAFDVEGIGFPGLLEVLSLHAHEPGSLELIARILSHPNLPDPPFRAQSNLVGNLVHHVLVLDDRLEQQGVVDVLERGRRVARETDVVRHLLHTLIVPTHEDILKHIPPHLQAHAQTENE